MQNMLLTGEDAICSRPSDTHLPNGGRFAVYLIDSSDPMVGMFAFLELLVLDLCVSLWFV